MRPVAVLVWLGREGGDVVTAVVVLSWDSGSRLLEFVEINGGAGGSLVALTVSTADSGAVSAELEGRDFPWSADLETDGGDVLIDASHGVHLRRCSVSV